MKSIFLDANILIDLISRRISTEEIIQILKAINRGVVYISALSVHITIYTLKIRPDTPEMEAVKNFCKKLNVIPLTNTSINLSLDTKYKDFEDMLQYFSAIEFCDTIITKDLKDFDNIRNLHPSKIKITKHIL